MQIVLETAMRVEHAPSTSWQDVLQRIERLRHEVGHVCVVLWPVSIAISPADWSLLDEQERHRAERFHRQQHRERFVAAHGGMRRLLSVCTGYPARELRFLDDDASKKPRLDGYSLGFNLTHSGDWAALAVSHDGDVGLDIEEIRPVEPALPQRYFSPQEQAALSTLTGEEWVAGFFRAWTRKEALLKAVGAGLSLPLDAFTVTLENEAPARLVASSLATLRPAEWNLTHVGGIPGYAGALATPSNVTRVSIFTVRDTVRDTARNGIE
ncbi:MAG TPA: 4'-phosphopantetheinyl transferase superfamily protein [Acidobacteriaceae bacterium]|nr:4'-phosphopantetheinyl transferase superfamily protein [Acidobacteriaceae bacterium]